MIPLIIPVSFGWAAGDVSLLAHIQSQLITDDNSVQSEEEDTRQLNAVMSFLYTTYIIMITFIANGIGLLFDRYKKRGDPQERLFYVAGIMMSCIAVVIFVSTWIEKGTTPSRSKSSMKEQEEVIMHVSGGIPSK